MIVFATVAKLCKGHNRANGDYTGDMKARTGKTLLIGLALALAVGVACHPKAPHSVTLTWEPSKPTAGETLVGYNVYRRTREEIRFEKIATQVSGPPYEDRSVASGKTYVYAVTVVDSKGHESRLSMNIQAAIP